MGRKFEAVKQNSDKGTDLFKTSQEMGKKAVSDTKKMKSLIDSLPSDVDDEILKAAEAIAKETQSDAIDYMQTKVSENVERGKQAMEQSSNDASVQIRGNEQVMKTFEKMDSVGNFGREARSSARTGVEQSTQSFESMISENNRKTDDAQKEYDQELSDISRTF